MMSHYEERLEKDLQVIRDRVKGVGESVDSALKNSVHATLTGNRELANSVILGDLPINREIREIDKLCHGFVAKHLPSAGHLRYVSSVLRLNIELERIGDYAVAIAREAVQLFAPPKDSVSRDVELLADQAQRIFRQAIGAFNTRNAEQARGIKGMAAQVESTYQKVFSDLIEAGETGSYPMRDLFALLVILNRLGRVSDQSKNICEETLFAEAGETKSEKVYRILFLDKKNNSLSQLAEVYARKAFPESGDYQSAGWEPAEGLQPALEKFLLDNGLDGQTRKPQLLDYTAEELGTFHVIVGLHPDAFEQLPEIPFHTVFTEWDVGEIPDDLDLERTVAHLEEAYKDLTPRIRELIETLRGEEAS